MHHIQHFLEKLEANLVDWVSAIAPWLAPIAPAYFVYDGVLSALNTPLPIAIIIGLAVEFVGLSSIHTTLQMWGWNREKGKTASSAPVWVAAAAVGFYLFVVLSVTVVVEQWPTLTVVVKGLLSLFTVPAALIVAVRSSHRQRIIATVAAREERRAARRSASVQTPSSVQRSNERSLNSEQAAAIEHLIEYMHANPNASQRQAAAAVGRSLGWVSTHLKRLNGRVHERSDV